MNSVTWVVYGPLKLGLLLIPIIFSWVKSVLPMLQYLRQSSSLDNKSLNSNLSTIDFVHWEEEEKVCRVFAQ